MSDDQSFIAFLEKAKKDTLNDLAHLERKAAEAPAGSEMLKEVLDLIEQARELHENLCQEEASIILGSEWDSK